MEIVNKILVTVLGLGSGILILRYSRQVTGFTGRFGWAEQYLGHGGTHTVIRLFGAALVFLFVLYPFGYWDKYTQDRPRPGADQAQTAPAAPAPAAK